MDFTCFPPVLIDSLLCGDLDKGLFMAIVWRAVAAAAAAATAAVVMVFGSHSSACQ